MPHPHGQYCGDFSCQECCPHDDFDHDMCIECGYERDPGVAIDAAMDAVEAAYDDDSGFDWD